MDNHHRLYRENSTKGLSIRTGQINQLPRKEYKTITVKVEAFQKFMSHKRVQKRDPSLDNSTFLNSLVTNLLEKKIKGHSEIEEPRKPILNDIKIAEELGTVNLLKISEGSHDATKLAEFLSANKRSHEDIKKITGVTILS